MEANGTKPADAMDALTLHEIAERHRDNDLVLTMIAALKMAMRTGLTSDGVISNIVPRPLSPEPPKMPLKPVGAYGPQTLLHPTAAELHRIFAAFYQLGGSEGRSVSLGLMAERASIAPERVRELAQDLIEAVNAEGNYVLRRSSTMSLRLKAAR